MNENTRKLQYVIQTLSSLQSHLDRVTSFLEDKCDNDEVTEEMVRYFTGPTEELERRIKSMVQDVEYLKEP